MTAPPVELDASDLPDAYARRNLILATMCLALVMVVSGVSMITNALPHPVSYTHLTLPTILRV